MAEWASETMRGGWVPIGRVRSTRTEPDDDGWDQVRSEIALDPGAVTADAVSGLDQFSHLEVVYLFDQVDPESVYRGARRPRDNPEWPSVGILAQRAKDRPNRIGVSRCRIESVDGLIIQVRDLDAIDGTPVLDVKPWMAEFGPRGAVRQPEWAHELMSSYWAAAPADHTAASTRSSYDRVAARYATEMTDEMAAKPLDRALIRALAELAGPGPALDAGSGPGQGAAEMVSAGLDAVACDLSLGMCLEARSAGLAAVAADMVHLPFRSSRFGALTSFYAVIHLDRSERRAVYREVMRVLRPGGYALLAFHTSDASTAAGGAVSRDEWWGEPVGLTFRFLDPEQELAVMAAAGLEVIAHLDRTPGPGPEYPSQRSYLFVRRPLASHGTTKR